MKIFWAIFCFYFFSFLITLFFSNFFVLIKTTFNKFLNRFKRFCPTIWHQLSIHDSIAPGASQAGCKLMAYTVSIAKKIITHYWLIKYIILFDIKNRMIHFKYCFCIIVSWNGTRRHFPHILPCFVFLDWCRTFPLISVLQPTRKNKLRWFG